MKRIDVDQAQRLMRRGALVVDVLPAPTYADAHLPGAISVPLTTLDDAAVAGIDRDRPLVVYCFDQRCDLSARASSRFDQLGFTAVHDLIGGRAAWTVLGLPTEGHVADRRRIGRHLRTAPTVSIDSTIGDVRALDSDGGPIAVVDADGVLLGARRGVPAPSDRHTGRTSDDLGAGHDPPRCAGRGGGAAADR